MRHENGARRLIVTAAVLLAVCSTTAAGASAQPAKKKPKTAANPAIVVTDKGSVRGSVTAAMRSFRGIQYAAAPVGALRWKPPQPVASWKGIKPALSYRSNCPQLASLFGHLSTNENCLFLNVFTPPKATAASKLPVMFWIHGGSLITGAGSDYNPSALVEQGVVVVTINYRLGLLGFLAAPALSAESATHSSGDYGLMDQQAALAWVHRNIARFGGNPKNVTIFGESAGGLSVRSHLLSPRSKGLFAKAIVESGAYTETLPTEAQAEAAGSAIATRLGCPDQTASCLRAVPVERLLKVEAATTVSQLPDVDGSVLTEDYATGFKNGTFNRVPVISGTNHDEWALFVALYADLMGNPVTDSNYVSQIAKQFSVSQAKAASLAAAYPPSQFPSAALALRALGTDVVFACNAWTDVRNLSQYVPTYQYEFNDPSPPRMFFDVPVSFPMGAYHGAELQYLWPTPTSTPLSAAQKTLALTMQRYWTDFAKTGDPNSAGLPAWPRYAKATDEAMSLVPPTPAPESTFAAGHRCSIWAPGS